MFQRLQVQLTILLAAFALLVIVSVGVTYWDAQTQQADALAINLAGRQRMLIQQMTAQAGDESAWDDLQSAKRTFRQTLSALQNGGEALHGAEKNINLPKTNDTQILSALAELESGWNAYSATLDAATSNTSSTKFQSALAAQSAELIQQADRVVQLYEAASIAKAQRLRAIQLTFLSLALILLALGAWLTRRSLLQPLKTLQMAAQRIGENQFDAPIQVTGPAEMRALAQAFEEMRARLSSARAELVQANATLEQRVAQRTQELEMLNEVSREISSRLDIQQVLNSVTDKARALLGGEVASLCLVDENHNWLKLQTLSGPKEAIVGNTMRMDNDFANAVLADDGAMLCGLSSCRGGCKMLADEYRASHLAAPLRVGERVIGALCVGSPTQDQFAAESANMLIKLANVAAIALENARLFAQAERIGTLGERHRVAAEMHDGLGQTLSYLGLMTDQIVEFLSDGQEGAALDRLRKTRETISKATGDVRRAINRLMDETLPANKDLWIRLREALDEVASQHDLEPIWRSDNLLTPEPSPQTAEQVYNIVHEALINAARHAKAQQISVQVGRNLERYFVIVQDNGTGFDTAQPAPSGHFGLQIMQARAKHIGGQVEFQSELGRGTRLTLSWNEERKI